MKKILALIVMVVSFFYLISEPVAEDFSILLLILTKVLSGIAFFWSAYAIGATIFNKP